MATHALIGNYTVDEHWKARYHHYDGYPNGLGRYLYDEHIRHFQGRLTDMLDLLISRNWLTLLHSDLSDPNSWKEYDNTLAASSDSDSAGVPWAYIFDAADRRMDIYVAHAGRWKRIAQIDLEQAAPNWDRLSTDRNMQIIQLKDNRHSLILYIEENMILIETANSSGQQAVALDYHSGHLQAHVWQNNDNPLTFPME